jgi:hypothetical protein
MRGTLLSRVGLAAVASIALALPSSAVADSPTQPSVVIEEFCDLPPEWGPDAHSGAWLRITGFPPDTTVLAIWEIYVNGTLVNREEARIGTPFEIPAGYFEPSTWVLTVVWEDMTLTTSAFIDCTSPPAEPGSKKDCENGGWRSFAQFKNQGECVSFVQRGPK